MNLPTKPAREIDNVKAGQIIRNARNKAEISLGRLAGAMGKHASYLCDLELGRRNWSPELFSCAEAKIQELIAEKRV